MRPPLIVWLATAVLALAAGAFLGARWSRRQTPADLPLREARTGLPNRAAALDHLPRALSLAERRGLSVTVLVIALDEVPASRTALDEAECDVARRLTPRLRTHEVLAHWGPGQFLVVLPDADVPSALVLAGDLRQLAAAPAADGPTARAGDARRSVSIGVHSRAPRGRQDLRELAAEMVIAAQRALEVTGANGPGRIEIEP
ncbi:diguanylate cyclase domain-containing protein [Tepidimonas sp.]|uniref:diguanylate cyclase domain-containing protein n=1 Tax=Tepidimonas sp. TaxID=2002775 RepID=UPI002FE0BFD7